MAKRTTDSESFWNGHDFHLQVGADGLFRVRPVVYFSISLSLLNSIYALNSATLRMTFADDPDHDVQSSAPSSIKVARMTQDWGEGSPDPGEGNFTTQAAWEWDTRFNSWSPTEAEIVSVTQTAEGNTVDFDIAGIVNSWIDGSTNYGVILMNESSETNTAKSVLFFSSDQSNDSRRPKLLLDYTTNTAPDEPINVSPTANAVVNTLTPTLTFTRDDPDTGDYISMWGISVYTDDYVSGSPTAAQTMWNVGFVPTTGQPTTISRQYGNPSGSAKPLVSGNFYKWRATYLDRGGLESPQIAVGSLYRFKVNTPPNTPNLVVPAPSTAIADNTPTFSLSHSDPDPADSVMHGYRVVVDKETTLGAGNWFAVWDSGDVDTSGSPTSSVQVTSGTLDWGGSFRVRARTKDSNGAWSSFSANKPFQTVKTSTPVNLAPSGSETTSATPTFTGERGSTSNTIVSYSIRVFSDDLATTMLAETNYTSGITSGATFSRLYAGAALSAGQSYQWQAKVESTIGGFSDWSTLQRFTVVDATTPTVVSPVGENAYTLTPTVTVDRVATFNRVQFEVYPSTSTTASLGTAHYQSGTISSSIGAGGLGTRYSATYAGTALTWDTVFKIRARVSSDGGSNWSSWSGLSSFRTAAAATPTLTSVNGVSGSPAWVVETEPLDPNFLITRGGSDTIDFAQVRLWDQNGTVLIWDSGLVNVTNATTAEVEYSGSATLSRDLYYAWDARYQSTTGPTGPYSTKSLFKMNSLPAPPTLLFPPPGHVFSDSDTKTFEAYFSDADVGPFGDSPTEWEIEIQEDDETPFDTEVIASNLVNGLNTITWPGITLAVGGYRWRTRFKDEATEWGLYSGWQSFVVSTPPNGTISTPTNGSNLSSVTPTVSWTYTGTTQQKFTIDIDETNSSGTLLRSITQLGPVFSDDDSFVIPAGYLRDTKYYDITLTVWNEDGLIDPSPSTVNVRVLLDAPNPIVGLFPTTYEQLSLVTLEWDVTTLKLGHSFVAYRVYRRLRNDLDFTFVADVPDINTNTYDDWYVGNSIFYEYSLRAVTTKSGVGVEMESPDDSSGGNLAAVLLDDDNWVLVGADREPDHVYPLLVEGENHNRPIQQEEFETLGSDRKVIMRGFVLGHEGSIETVWQNRDAALPSDVQVTYNETVIGRRLVDYITFNPGPHILKSPFGDVWDVQFMTPEYKWLPVGHLSVVLNWVETGTTSQVSI
jgi:hypothetical protein